MRDETMTTEESEEEEEEEEEGGEEEEEIIVYANFEEGTVEKKVFQIPNVKLKILGLDSSNPIVQLKDSTFKGEWKDAIGTKILLEEDSAPEQADPTFAVMPEIMLKYKCKTRKMLDLSRIFLKPKSSCKAEEADRNDETRTEATNDDDANEAQVVDEIIQRTVKPDDGTDSLMKDIVDEAMSE